MENDSDYEEPSLDPFGSDYSDSDESEDEADDVELENRDV